MSEVATTLPKPGPSGGPLTSMVATKSGFLLEAWSGPDEPGGG